MNIRKNVIFNHDNKKWQKEFVSTIYLFLTHELNSQLRCGSTRMFGTFQSVQLVSNVYIIFVQ